MRPVLRLAVLVSGSGRTLENLQRQVLGGRLDARIAGVLCSRPDAYALERARRLRLPAAVADPRDFPDRRAFWGAVAGVLDDWAPDLAVMAGWLCYWRIPKRWAGRVVNIHPSLLPAFGGKGFYGDRVHRAVLAAGARVSGCTVHAVDNVYDHGTVLAQARVPVRRADDVHALGTRVFRAESRLYPEVLRRIASGRIPLPLRASGASRRRARASAT